MKTTAQFHRDAEQSYRAHFGKKSEAAKCIAAILAAEERGDYDLVEELRETERENVLSVEQMTHSFRDNCEFEILLGTGGPAARVVVEVNIDNEVRAARFEFQDWGTPWYAPTGQDCRLVIEYSYLFFLQCRYCAEENGW